MLDLEGKLRSVRGAIGTGLLAGALVLSPVQMYNANAQSKGGYTSEAVSIPSIRDNMIKRGYMTLDEFQTAVQCINRSEYVFNDGTRVFDGNTPHADIAISVVAEAINKDLLPYKAMFYLSLENKDYEDAETIRRNWVGNLKYLVYWYSKLNPTSNNFDPYTKEKIKHEIGKLNKIGLTDPMLIELREELTLTIKNKQWDDALKIQNLIEGRMRELQFAKNQLDNKNTLEARTTNVYAPQEKQSSKPHITIENIPRYGAGDIGRAISILEGKGGKLDPKAEGTLKLFDILFKR